MKTCRFVLTAASLFAFVTSAAAVSSAPDGSRAQAQPPAASKPADPPPAIIPPPIPVAGMGRNVQVDLTVKVEGTGPGVNKHMTLVSADGTTALGRAGLDIPVQMLGGNTQYRSVGLNVDARPRIFDGNRISLMLKLEFSSVVKADGATSGAPSFGSAKTELYLALETGKPLVISQAADAEVGRGYSVEVKATILK
jgi:hypothetical protein